MKDNNEFGENIRKAERKILIFSWLGIFASLAVMASSVWCLL